MPPPNNDLTKTFGNWIADPEHDTITYEPNGYYLHRDHAENTAEFWLEHLREKSWYTPLSGTNSDPFLVQAMKYLGWL